MFGYLVEGMDESFFLGSCGFIFKVYYKEYEVVFGYVEVLIFDWFFVVWIFLLYDCFFKIEEMEIS